MVHLVLVNCDDQSGPSGVQQAPGQDEPPRHEGQPLAVPVGVAAVDVVVVVLPVSIARVIRGVRCRCSDLPLVCIQQRFVGVIVLSVDKRVEGLVAASLDAANVDKPW